MRMLQTLVIMLTLLLFKLLYFDLTDVQTDNHAMRTNKSAFQPFRFHRTYGSFHSAQIQRLRVHADTLGLVWRNYAVGLVHPRSVGGKNQWNY